MAPSKLKRMPDAAVSMAVAQILKQQKSKRMMMFGLRNLSELCSPDKSKHKENSVAAMVEGIVPVLASNIASYGDDEDVVLCSIKILKGISDYLVEEKEQELIDKLQQEGGVDAGLRVLTGYSGADEQALVIAVDYFLSFTKLGYQLDAKVVVSLVQALGQSKSSELSNRLLRAMMQFVDQTETTKLLLQSNAWGPILDALITLDPAHPDAVSTAEMGLTIIQKMLRVGKAPPTVMDKVIKVLDIFKGKKSIIDKGSATLALMLSPEELKSCLDALATAPKGSQERHLALTTLTSMSYISSYAEAVVQAGAIPLLCDAVQTSADELSSGTPDPLLVKGLNGACKMLARIADNPSNVDAITNADGLQALTNALAAAQGIPLAAPSCMEALIPLLRKENNAQDFHLLEGYDFILTILKKQLANIDVAAMGMSCLATALTHEVLAGTLYDQGVVGLASVALKYHCSNVTYQMNCISCLKITAKLVTDYSQIENGHRHLIKTTLETATEHRALAIAMLELLERISEVPRAVTEFQDGDTADAVLTLMLAHPDDADVQFIGKALLEVIATEKDVKRCLDDLNRCLQDAKTHAAKAYRALAAVNGLSQISRLTKIFEEKKASSTIQNAISFWIQSPPFSEQQKIIKAAALSAESLQLNSSTAPDATIIPLLTTSLLPQLRTLSERQDLNDSNLLDIVSCCRRLCSSSQKQTEIPTDHLNDLVEAITKVMWKYQDLRRVQVLCLEMLEEIAAIGNGFGARLLVNSGVVKNVISYMSKVVIYEDVQVAGLRLLKCCLEKDPNLVEPLKFAGAVEVCKSIQSHHASSPQVKALLPTIAGALMPSDFLNQDMKAALDAIQKALLKENHSEIIASLETLLALTSTSEGAKNAVNLRIGNVLQHLSACYAPENATEESAEIAVLVSNVMKELCHTRAGINHLNRYGGKAILLNFLTILMDTKLPDKPSIKEGIEANLQAFGELSRILPGGGTAGSSVELKRLEKLVPLFTTLVRRYPEEAGIGGAAAAALTALPTPILANSADVTSMLEGFVVSLTTGGPAERAAAAAALAQLLNSDDDARFTMVQKCGGVIALFKALDQCGHHEEVRTTVLNALLQYSRKQNLYQLLENERKDGGARQEAIHTLHRVVKEHCDKDPASAIAALRILNSITNAADKQLLMDLELIDLVSELMRTHPDSKGLSQVAGELFKKCGAESAIEQLMSQVILVATSKPDEGWRRSLELLCLKLAALLPTDVEDVRKTFGQAAATADALAPVIRDEKDDPTLIEAVTLVLRRLVDRFALTENREFGTEAVARKAVPAIAEVLSSPTAKAAQNKDALMNMYHILAVCARDPGPPQDAAVATAASSNLVEISYARLKKNESDPQLVLRILEYLDALASSEKGLAVCVQQQRAFRTPGREEENDHELAVAPIVGLLKRYKSFGPLAATGTSYITSLLLNDPKLLPRYLSELARVVEVTPEGFIGLLAAYKTAIEANQLDALRDELEKIDEHHRRLSGLSSTTNDQKLEMDIAYAELLKTLAQLGELELLRKMGAVDALITLLHHNYNQSQVLLPTIQALKELADLDADFNATIARTVPSLLTGPCAPTIKADPLLCQAVLSLLYSLACNEGNGKLIASTVGFDQLMTAIDASSSQFPLEEADEMKKLAASFKYMVEQDNPQALTLKQVYERWTARKTAGDTLEITESVVVLQQLDFVCDYTKEYGSSKVLKGLDTELGSEFRYGCLCFSLLHEYPLNSGICIEKGEPQILLQALEVQQDQNLIQCSVLAARDMCAHFDCAMIFSNLPNAKDVTLDLLTKFPPGGNAATPQEADELITPRLELLERTAISRNTYNGETCISTLVSIWDDCDKGVYTVETLRYVFRAMRRVLNESWTDPILSHEIPQRLLVVVNETDLATTGPLLRDVLFLLGKLAVVPEIKLLLIELNAVQAFVDLLKRAMKNRNEHWAAAATNTCLALANLTIKNDDALDRFVSLGGIQVVIQVLESAMDRDKWDYDISNAAAILITNLCYKNDYMKEQFGSEAVPRVLTHSIQKYDGSDSRSAFRCLASILNAVGNLATYLPNIDRFLEERIEETFAYLYDNAEFIPDDLLETSLRTMSNLVLENTDDAMLRFGVVLTPILAMLQGARRESVRMLSLAFEVLTNLSRLPTNAEQFVVKNGIETTLHIVNTHSDPHLSVSAIHLLAVQATNPECLQRMIAAGAFKFLANVFETQAVAEERSTELCVAALRCVRRLLLDRDATDVFLKADGLSGILHMITQCPETSMIQLDGYRTILALLSFYPPPEPKPQTSAQGATADADWNADVADEGVLGVIHRMERPPSPRSWEAVGFEPGTVGSLILSICSCLAEEAHLKQYKLQRCGLGLLAYFACEKIEEAVQAFYAGTFNLPVRQAITTFPEPDILQMVCCILINVAYVSDSEYYRNIARDKALQQALEEAATKLPRKSSSIKDLCVTTARLLADRKDPDPKKFENLTDWDFPLELTEWNLNPYPNGLQDLSPEIKKQLREGARAKIVYDAKVRSPFWWKSSQDLMTLQWKTTDDPTAPYNNSVPISRLRTLKKGTTTPLLKAAAAKDRKLDPRVCMSILGPISDDAPTGLEINLKLKSKKERDQLWTLICEWRDASTYGF